MKITTKLLSLLLLFAFACSTEEPPAENEEEVIDKVTLTFTPTTGDALTFTATDPDGEGPESFAFDGPVNLATSTSYTLTITMTNTQNGEDITAEVSEEAEEHMLFFSFTNDLFSDPLGNGNIDDRADDVNYNDADMNGLPLGLSTDWTTGAATSSGVFKVVLKHQPGVKSATSTAEDGSTDVDLQWTVNIGS